MLHLTQVVIISLVEPYIRLITLSSPRKVKSFPLSPSLITSFNESSWILHLLNYSKVINFSDMKNIEIKAKVDNIDEIEEKAKQISDSPLVVINQHDIFFNLSSTKAALGGRLKLRQFDDGTGELIFYERPDITGPKMSTYSRVQLDSERRKELRQVLTEANGVLGTIEKTRHLYMVGQTRIHIDRVLGLGNFMELEVVLDNGDDSKKGEEIAKNLMNTLGITENSLLSGAYLDMILQK